MKTIIIFCSLAVLFSCSKSQPGGVLEDVTDLGAFLDGDGQALYVRTEHVQRVLHALQAKQAGDSMYTTVLGDDRVSFRIVTTETPYIYADGLVESSLLKLRWKIYFNAQCGQFHPGFTSDCIQTFDEHAARGNFMIWRVNNWHSCMKGDSLCIEKYKPVGTIEYHSTNACMDSSPTVRTIMRYRCD